jgi:hypothetical protein
VTDVADILRAAADLLEHEGAWTRETMARDEDDRPVGYANPDACSWCAGGAIFKVGGDRAVRDQAMDFLSEYVGAHGIGDWNDAAPGPEPVITALRAAAEKAS